MSLVNRVHYIIYIGPARYFRVTDRKVSTIFAIIYFVGNKPCIIPGHKGATTQNAFASGLFV